MDAQFVTSLFHREQFPPENLPEVVVLGRSNCGKSTLINRITNRKSLVRTSSTPGCTQSLNIFLLNQAVQLVDVPGYGFNKAGDKVRQKWNGLIAEFLGRPTIALCLCLLDCRRKIGDEEWALLSNPNPYTQVCLVLTKTDKMNRGELFRKIAEVRGLLDGRGLKGVEIITASVQDNQALEGLRERVLSLSPPVFSEPAHRSTTKGLGC